MLRVSLPFLLLATGPMRVSAQQEGPRPAGSVVPVRGEASATGAPLIKAAPESHLLDDCGIFSPEEREQLSKDLISASEASGINVYAVTMTFLTDGSCEQHARRLAADWATPEKPCAVALFEQGTNEIQYSTHFVKVTPEEDQANAEMWKAVVGYAEAMRLTELQSARVARVAAAFRGMAQGLASYRTEGKVPEAPPPAAAQSARSAVPTAPASSGSTGAGSLPEKPGSFVADTANILPPDDEAALAKALTRFSAEHDAELYVVTLTWAPMPAVLDRAEKELESGAQATATQLLQTWMPSKFGAVIVHEQATGKLGIATATDEAHWLTVPAIQKALDGARRTHAAATSPAEAVQSCALELLSSFVAESPEPQTSAGAPRAKPHVLVLQYVAAALCLIFGAIYLIQRRQAKRRHTARARFFPEVTVGMRLGAPMGGGVVESSE